jgi:hypothetical protein
MTQQDFLIAAMRLVNIVGAGQTPNVSELSDVTGYANSLLENWSIQHLFIYLIKNRTFSLVADQGSYTMGVGGDFKAARPVKIQSAGIVQANGLRSPLTIIDSKRWASIPEKTGSSMIQPLELYNDNDYPLTNIHLWPPPKCTTATSIDMWVWQALASLTWRYYTDLVIGAADNKTATSALYPFTAADIGNYINITGGAGFTITSPPLRAKITAVNGAIATFDKALGVVGSTGGQGTYDSDLVFPPGYEKSLRYALAVEIAREWGRDASSIVPIAEQAKKDLANLNLSNGQGLEDPQLPAE